MSSLHRPRHTKTTTSKSEWKRNETKRNEKKRKERTNPPNKHFTFVYRMPTGNFSCAIKQNKTEHFWNSTAINESSMLSQIQNLRYGSNGFFIVRCLCASVLALSCLLFAFEPHTFTCKRGSLLFIQIESLIQLFELFSIFNVCV